MFSKLWLYLAVAGTVAIGSLWVMHKIDEAKYAKLQAQVAQAHATQLTRVIQERDKFAVALRAAEKAAADEKALRDAEAVKQAAAFRAALTKARNQDAQLDRCLRTRLPDDVLRTLPH